MLLSVLSIVVELFCMAQRYDNIMNYQFLTGLRKDGVTFATISVT